MAACSLHPAGLLQHLAPDPPSLLPLPSPPGCPRGPDMSQLARQACSGWAESTGERWAWRLRKGAQLAGGGGGGYAARQGLGRRVQGGGLGLARPVPKDPGVPLTPPTSDSSFQDSPTTRGQGTGDLRCKTLAGSPAWGVSCHFPGLLPQFPAGSARGAVGAHTARAWGRGVPTHRCPRDPRSGPTGTSAPRPGSRAAPGFPPARFRAGWTVPRLQG